ncbi:hypothetical protein [Burkholderia cenocepacia]|uniref:hypothetical protein n=1 Tax=Burkholderia cenocepacia TaxID=95486 RepID=UPI002AB7D76E|nr:hypothetical protein [Burkholderia cenocepacia]
MSKTLTDDRIKEVVDAIDFGKMVTADDYIYLIARAIEREVLATQQPEPRDEVKPRLVKRHSDMSVLAVFCSAREASVFEKEIRARAGGQ